MPGPRTILPLPLVATPLEIAAGWPADVPLLMLHSGGRHARWARWSILARPQRWLLREAGPGVTDATLDPLAQLAAALAATRREPRADAPVPFDGGWVGFLSYDLGAVFEPTARAARPRDRAVPDRVWPLFALAWCPDALVHDHQTGTWYEVGADSGSRLADTLGSRVSTDTGPLAAGRRGVWSSSLDPDAYLSAVARTLDYIAAGDAFQANITQRLSAPWTGSPRALGRRALAVSRARYGAYLELPDGRTIVSMSPELFLEVDGSSRGVITRPVKGTRPRHVSGRELIDSEKDAAELHMIVDLMRNDLGRVCEYGSVQVPEPRTIETHGLVHHGVGAVTGRLRPAIGPVDLLRATFPPGSVTGAPKIRAMQIIDELEPVGRGPYCGAIGFIGDDGGARLNVAIRTLVLTPAAPAAPGAAMSGTLDYGVGGGVVADSDPLAEYRESLDKAAILSRVFGGEGTKGRSDEATKGRAAVDG